MRFPLWIRPVLTMSMMVLLPLLMAYQIMSQGLHAILGTGFLLLLILHTILNRHWYASITRGRYTPSRILSLLINFLLPLLFLLTIGSGLVMIHSSYPILHDWISPAMDLHLLLSHWSFLLAAIHLGLHGRMITIRIKQRAPGIFRPLTYLAYGLSLFGIWFFYDLRIADYLFRQSLFAFFDTSTPAPVVLLKCASIFILFAICTHQGYTQLQRAEQKMKNC